MNSAAVAAALRQLAIEAELAATPKRPRGRPRKPPPTVTSGDAKALEAMGVTLTRAS